MAEKLSVVIITFNEEKNIERCLLSVKKVADEIIVVDSFSTDRTKEIANRFDVRFVEQKWLGYSEQKNFANGLANNLYVLSLDADEALTEELEISILKQKEIGFTTTYSFNRLTNYCGSWVRYSSWYPDTKVRIFNSKKISWEGEIHETLNLLGENVNHLTGDLLHYSYYTIEDHRNQIDKFSSISANMMFQKRTSGAFSKMWYKPIARFIKIYLIHRGFLDGKAGFSIAKLSAYAVYLKYFKLNQLNHEKPI
jgi:glycosyltransferase involved in cell wall biosynthesis